MTSDLEPLYLSLQQRLRPEDVAELVLQAGVDYTAAERRVIDVAGSHSFLRGLFKVTSMMQEFRVPVAPVKQVRKSEELFHVESQLSGADIGDTDKLLGYIEQLSREIRKTPTESDFLAHRLSRENRRERGMDISRRRYNKLFRFLGRLEAKVKTYQFEQRKYRAGRIAKSSLALDITYGDFADSTAAACFVAYYSARCNRRSVFTNKGQDRAFDEIAETLLDVFKRNPTERGWKAIAYVMPDAEIVAHLSDEDKLILLGRWLAVLHDIADLLKQTWEISRFDRSTMIVQLGDDSSTWNALAGGWNAARQGWLGVMHGLGLEAELEAMCFGKVLRLMAGDVAAWHESSGGRLEPDTAVWAELPAPWMVFDGKATCTRAEVEEVCRKHGVNPLKKGWTAPRSGRDAVPFKPTPELVHGVTVSHPELALLIRKAGWFSGKPSPGVGAMVHRDETRFKY